MTAIPDHATSKSTVRLGASNIFAHPYSRYLLELLYLVAFLSRNALNAAERPLSGKEAI
jgi:hypothetical protein